MAAYKYNNSSYRPALWRLKAKADDNREEHARNARVCLAFGFGILQGKNGKEKPGKENKEIWKQIIETCHPEMIICQEAVLLASKASTLKKKISRQSGIKIIRMHDHSPDDYYDTIRASVHGLRKIDEYFPEGPLKIAVFAHYYQLNRVAWILYQLKKMNPSFKRFEFIIPETNVKSFSSKSIHVHTRYKLLYLMVELGLSRPRDFIHIQLKKHSIWK